MWERDPSLPKVVAHVWATKCPDGDLGTVALSLKELMYDLKEWSRNKFGNVLKEIEKLRGELDVLQKGSADHATIRNKMFQLDELLYREEMMSLRRSRVTWLKEGERNTKYLHHRAVWWARRNYIQHLKKEDGSWCSSPSDMERMASSYFQGGIYQGSHPTA